MRRASQHSPDALDFFTLRTRATSARFWRRYWADSGSWLGLVMVFANSLREQRRRALRPGWVVIGSLHRGIAYSPPRNR